MRRPGLRSLRQRTLIRVSGKGRGEGKGQGQEPASRNEVREAPRAVHVPDHVKRALSVLVVVACTPIGVARSEPRPALDDFYQRTRDRTEGFDRCTGYCDGDKLAAFLIGAQTANPSTDAVRQAWAYGGRFGLDVGAFWDRYSLGRTKLWTDVLQVEETGDTLTDFAWDTTVFQAFGDPGEVGLHLSLDGLVAERSELEPSDLAEFQVVPYRVVDVEMEVTPTGPKVDKDAFLALPMGIQGSRRWTLEGDRLEDQTSLSAGLAFRGFLKQRRHHYQLDALRVKHKRWTRAEGEATEWSLSAGYQRLSPDVDWLSIWLLAGYGWHMGANERRGLIAQLGAEMEFEGEEVSVAVGPMVESHLALEKRTNRFERVNDLRFYYRHEWGPALWGLSWQSVLVGDQASLHALVPELGARLWELEFRARFRATFEHDTRFWASTPQDRFNFSVDWLF